MWTYQAPVADMLHLLTRVLEAPASRAGQPAFAELDADTAGEVLQQAGRFASEVTAPTSAAGDVHGCTWSREGVATPSGFREAYRAFIDGGWPSLARVPEAGGQGLPQVLNMALLEMPTAANHGWTMYPGLLHGAYEVVLHHAAPSLRERYLSRLVSGEWLCALCPTEPQAGSDLGQVRTRAELDAPNVATAANGAPVRITGQKIFIRAGDHDLTDNIVHLVLCRLAGASAGSKGLTLALVPKLMPDGSRNAETCDGIETKMDIHGSTTCQRCFERAQGWLIGKPHRGLAAMFLMMNAARLHVAIQDAGPLEAATQNAWRHAADRVQVRAPQRPTGAPTGPGPDPIAWHPAVCRTVLALRARIDAVHPVAYWCAMLLDEADHHPDAERRAAAAGHVALLTPVAKSLFAELGHRSVDEALQIWGGYGYVHDYGSEQAVCGSRTAMIYEGTNEIQAIDLVQRKLLDDRGACAEALIGELAREVASCRKLPALQPFADALDEQLAQWHQSAAFGLKWLVPQPQMHWARALRRDADLPFLAT